MRLLRFISLMIFLACFSSTHAQSIFRGKVFDAETGEPLIGATILFENGGTTSNPEGSFELSLPAGAYSIQIGYVGYQEAFYDFLLKEGQVVEENFSLQRSTSLLEAVTVSSGKYERELKEVTVSMEVLPQKFLEQLNATSADDALSNISGVTVADGQANVRGGSGWSYGAGSRVLLLIDDIPALQQDAAFPNWDDIPMENIGQIENLKGAGSALYGSAAMNGVINIRSAYAKSDPYTQLSTHYRVYDTPQDTSKKWWDEFPFETSVRLAHRQKLNDWDLTAGAFYLSRNSFRQNTGTDYGRINLNGRYHFSDKNQAGVNVNFNAGKSRSAFYWKLDDCKCGSYESDSTTLSVTERVRYTIDPFFQTYDKDQNRHRFTGRFYGINNESGNDQSNSSSMLYGEYQFQKRWEPKGIVLSAGLVQQATFSKSELYSDTTFTLLNTGIYAQLEAEVFDRLNLSAGGRFERNSIKAPNEILVEDVLTMAGTRRESKPVFRTGINYSIASATFIRASIGQGYRYPTLAEGYISTSAGGLNIIPNPALESETGVTLELGIKQGFKIKSWDGYLDAALFDSKYQNMMEFTLIKITGSLLSPTPVFQARNVGDTQIRGMEFSLGSQGSVGPIDLTLSGGITLIDPVFKEFDLTGKEFGISLPEDPTDAQVNAYSSSSSKNVLKYRHKTTTTANLLASWKWITLGINHRYGSRMDAIDTGFLLLPVGIFDYRENHDDGYQVLDLRTDFKLKKGISLGLHVENLFNYEYSLRPGLLEAPRSFLFRLTWQKG
ncbi:MAG: TonB-dependent receptor [Saprospiraceae bacterium]|nr:TonB-dependent receptor [Saprospiraceae bacterium]